MPARFRVQRNGNDGASLIKATARERQRRLEGYATVKMRQLWRDAVREGIRTIVYTWIASGSIDTGMSVASLMPLARAPLKPSNKRIIGAVSIVQAGLSARKNKTPGGRRGAYAAFPSGAANNKRAKSIAEGIRAGQNAYVLQVGTPKSPFFRFEFDISVFQWLYHEDIVGRNSIGLQTLNEGITAMRNFIRENYSRYISTEDLLNIFADKEGRVRF